MSVAVKKRCKEPLRWQIASHFETISSGNGPETFFFSFFSFFFSGPSFVLSLNTAGG